MRDPESAIEYTVNMGASPWSPELTDEFTECGVEYTPTLGYQFNAHDLANSAYIPTSRHALRELAGAILKFLDETPEENHHA